MCFENQQSLLDNSVKVATLIIALVNLFLLIKFTVDKNEKDDKFKERERKIQWLKTLILDNNLLYFYDFFDALEVNLDKLKEVGLNDEDKAKIEDSISNNFIKLRRKFSDTLNAIDQKLYKSIIDLSDDLQEKLVDSIFDKGVNLEHEPKYEELILSRLTVAKTNMLKVLFEYKG
jgi:hypothetical protein